MTSRQPPHKRSTSNIQERMNSIFYSKWNNFMQQHGMNSTMNDWTFDINKKEKVNQQELIRKKNNDDEKVREVENKNENEQILLLKAKCEEWHRKFLNAQDENIKLKNRMKQLERKVNEMESAKNNNNNSAA